MDFISQLPDCLLSSILTTLSMKDLLKTSVLSRRWSKLWSLRRDLNFDIHNVLGTEKELLENGYLIDIHTNSTMDRCADRDVALKPLGNGRYLIDISTIFPMERSFDMDLSRDVFVKRVDQLVKHFQGSTKIDSFLLDFSLYSDQSSIIDQWLSFAIARGVGRIDLHLIGGPYAHRTSLHKRKTSKRYKFDFGLFSESNASTLKHLSLQNCVISHPTNCDFIPFKNLRSLALEEVKVDEMFITSLLSNCQLLEELCLSFCDFKSSIPKIVSSSLCHLKVSHCCFISNNIIECLNLSSMDCPKLTSLEYRGGGLKTLYINSNSPMLKSIEHSIGFHEILEAFAIFATLPELEILHLGIHLRVTTSLKITQPLKYLKQLNLFVWWDDSEFDLLWILAILQASPLLQKLSVMVMYSNLFENQKDIKDVEIFSHDEVKVIELGGCVGNWYEIEFAMNVLKYAHKLERIVLSPYWDEDDDPCDRNFDPVWFQIGRERISDKLQSEEVVGREKLVLI